MTASPRTIVDVVRTGAARYSAAVAVLSTDPGETMTYGELAGTAEVFGAELRRRVIGPSDVVMVVPNEPAPNPRSGDE